MAKGTLMGDYMKAGQRDEVIQGFMPANPAKITPKGSVRKELKDNTFNGGKHDDPLEYLHQFHETCESQPLPDDVTFDQAKLVLFKYSLGKTTKDWLFCLPSGIVQTWKELDDRFLDLFFTEEQYKERKRAILEFQQEKRESLHQSLERFKLYRRRCPNHYLCAAELMQISLNNMSIS
jgi:hypothetical protein